MVLELPLTAAVEADLRQRAAALGIDVQAFVLKAVTEKLAEEQSAATPVDVLTARKQKIDDCIALHPIATQTLDDSREAIYEGRGE